MEFLIVLLSPVVVLVALEIEANMPYRIYGTATPLTVQTRILQVVRDHPGITTAMLIEKFDFSRVPNFNIMFFLYVAKEAGRLKETRSRWYLTERLQSLKQ